MRSEVATCFKSIDTDNNGFISLDEISIMIKSLGHKSVPLAELNASMTGITGKESEEVSLSEFEAWYEKSMFWTAHREKAETELEASEGKKGLERRMRREGGRRERITERVGLEGGRGRGRHGERGSS
jgi:EF-hand domain